MQELKQRYQQIRCILTNLAQTISDDSLAVRSEHELQRSHAYLSSHCAECGCTIHER